MDRKQQTMRARVSELLGVEQAIAEALENQQNLAHANANVAAALDRFLETPRAHARALAEYLRDETAAAAPDPVVGQLTNAFGTLTAALRADYAAFNYAAIGYASLFEAALRLYDPALRELAPRHLRAYAEAAQTVNQLIASATAHELVQEGLECECICPMCSIGACGCVALGTATINTAWAEAAPVPAAGDGFPLQRPRPDSQLATAGVQAGDRLLAIDDEHVAKIPDIQAAIRKHALGEEMRLLIQRGSEEPRELRVQHVGDYA